jgi:hypothetical protein
MAVIAAAASADTIRVIRLEDSAVGTQAAAEHRATGDTMAHSQQLPNELVQKLQKAQGDKLISVVLYGSAATPGARDRRSDFNILCVLNQVTPSELHAAEPVFRWWREMKNPSPLLFGVEELRRSTDCFPMEFHDIKERHSILFGENLVSDLEINDRYYRAMVEHELRAKLLRLRQKAGGVLSENDLLLRLMIDSVSTFCVVFRHALRLAGDEPLFEKHEIVSAAAQRFGIDAAPLMTLLDLRNEKVKPRDVQPGPLFREYLQQIQVVIAAVDQLQ